MQRDELKKKLILTVLKVRVNINNNLIIPNKLTMNPTCFKEQTRINGIQSTCGLHHTFKIKIIL